MGCLCCKPLDPDEYKGLLSGDNTARNTLMQAIVDNDEDLLQDPEIKAILTNKTSDDDMDELELENYIKSLSHSN
ncbi:hypothetical protein TVAGG3_0707480 [Trichomonas vaginalis G3]|uniref:hypothetical protein n=1 Tax=Trichomonas vaginalis (strain ATCC PRA-98 / G3) TaxID=412133 RepID=UPI0021E5EAA2|nr:hypothetical protein TVAGG3_0707480 [Trichomonas vaginalis G3]KAI5509661.1 hypothetical protein TVAGG3_0707480 [Trichomonas vaginalis G3]